MCGPQAAMLGAQAAGTAYSTVGSYYAAREKKAALNAQADLAEINARMSERSAQQALRKGQLEQQKSRLKNAALKSSQKVSLAANGIDLGSDSAIALLTTTDVFGEIDANEIARGALQDAWGYRTQGVNAQNQAIMARGQSRGINPFLSATGTLLTGATDVATSYYTAKKIGALEGGKK